ncbi:hypothetical protein BGX23_000306 [Mortierella sp. AD031]|nr:hypothetical protein BGX23_000306 [Mortierella sp. AD031]
MSDSNIVIAFFAILVAGKIALIVQCFLNKKSFSSPSSSSPYLVMSDMETGPQVLVEDPMTQRLLLSGGGGPEESQVDLQIPPPVYTIKDEHLEFENDPPPPSFADAVPSSHPFKSKRRLSRLSVVPTNFDPNLDTYQHESTSDNMRVLPTLGVLSPSVIVHM